ncbi:putative rap guanine nucleotide exchange factor 6-like isoform X17 [Penaeus vannamei]|uniref:Putative rap guanine nucleotide exchange factor 6-like isoform X17 n=1 Tax=Penaeus vannamei TaxID=6689 RepID=A0A3R7MG02_PENVA|nr:putative rap guanine nucleotide exchange factor 6-like isoform X17 [Penaeus vannamei]
MDLIYGCLRGMEALCWLREPALRALCRTVRYEMHTANDILYCRGELATCWYILLSGSVFIDGSMFLPRSSSQGFRNEVPGADFPARERPARSHPIECSLAIGMRNAHNRSGFRGRTFPPSHTGAGSRGGRVTNTRLDALLFPSFASAKKATESNLPQNHGRRDKGGDRQRPFRISGQSGRPGVKALPPPPQTRREGSAAGQEAPQRLMDFSRDGRAPEPPGAGGGGSTCCAPPQGQVPLVAGVPPFPSLPLSSPSLSTFPCSFPPFSPSSPPPVPSTLFPSSLFPLLVIFFLLFPLLSVFTFLSPLLTFVVPLFAVHTFLFPFLIVLASSVLSLAVLTFIFPPLFVLIFVVPPLAVLTSLFPFLVFITSLFPFLVFLASLFPFLVFITSLFPFLVFLTSLFPFLVFLTSLFPPLTVLTFLIPPFIVLTSLFPPLTVLTFLLPFLVSLSFLFPPLPVLTSLSFPSPSSPSFPSARFLPSSV